MCALTYMILTYKACECHRVVHKPFVEFFFFDNLVQPVVKIKDAFTMRTPNRYNEGILSANSSHKQSWVAPVPWDGA